MTAATQLSALTAHDVDISLVFDGVPVMLATRAGLVHPLTADVITNPPGSLVSLDAINRDSFRFGKQELNLEARMVRPSSMSFSLRMADLGDSVQWDDYFNMRKAPVTSMTAAITETGTSATVASTTGFGFAPIYAHSESMLVTGIGPTTFTVTRNYCRLTPIVRPQVHNIGTEVRTTPRMWLGHWCEVRVWVGGETQQIWYMQLAGPPTRNKRTGEWSLSFNDILRVLDRDVSVGFDGADVAYVANASTGGEPNIQLTPPPNLTREFQDYALRRGSLIVQDKDSNWCMERIQGFTGTSPVIDGNSWFTNFGDWKNITSMRRAYVFTGQPMVAALQIMLSNRGLGENDPEYDVLFGITAYGDGSTSDGRVASGEKECRMGANIPPGLLDMETLTGDILYQTAQGFNLCIGAGSEKLLTILEGIAHALNGDWFVNAQGLISFRRDRGTSDAIAAADYTITEDDIEQDETSLVSMLDEAKIAPVMQIVCNWDPVAKKFLGTMTSIFEQEAQTYESTDLASKSIQIQRKDLLVQLNGTRITDITGGYGAVPATEATVRVGVERTQQMYCRGLLMVDVTTSWKYSNVRPGMRVKLTFSQLIDFAGNTLSNYDFKVLSVTPTENGKITIGLQETWAGKILSPTFQVHSFAGSTITLKNAAKWTPSGIASEPCLFAAAGWKVKLLRRTASPRYSQYESFTINSLPADDQMILNANPSWGNPAIDDLIVFDVYDTAVSAAVNAMQGQAQHDHVFQADNLSQLGAAPAAGDKWG